MQRDQTIPIKASSDEKIGFQEFAKDNNRSVSQLFRDSVGIVMRNPSLLDPTGETAQLMFAFEKSRKASSRWDKLVLEAFVEQQERMDSIDRKVDSLMETKGFSKNQIENIGKKQSLKGLINGQPK